MSLYADLILDHYQHPRNNTLLTSEVSKLDIKSIDVSNPLCGDKLHMEIREQDGVIQEIGFTAEGCAISIASASMLTEYAKGKTKKELLDISTDDVLGLLKIELTPNRMKCALLSWEGLMKLLSSSVDQTLSKIE
ncbi:MAG: iron-sulfur cluster assembly scaffold protein [Candidatus Roizmanbacteria bacterium]|nr:iron-sulfur cluster assembly scaffold protein [Candidatus Roizmanbacteria bacterium]